MDVAKLIELQDLLIAFIQDWERLYLQKTHQHKQNFYASHANLAKFFEDTPLKSMKETEEKMRSLFEENARNHPHKAEIKKSLRAIVVLACLVKLLCPTCWRRELVPKGEASQRMMKWFCGTCKKSYTFKHERHPA